MRCPGALGGPLQGSAARHGAVQPAVGRQGSRIGGGDGSAGDGEFGARLFGTGAGRGAAITYEYGNALLIVASLLNMLVGLDALDITHGRK